MSEQTPFSTPEEKFQVAQQAVVEMERMIARTARTIAIFSGMSYQQAYDEICSNVVEAIVTHYDPQKKASPTTFAYNWILATVTEIRRRHRKQSRLVEYPEEGFGEIASPDSDPATIIEEDDSSQLVPARLIEEMNIAYEKQNKSAMIAAAKSLAYYLAYPEQGALTTRKLSF